MEKLYENAFKVLNLLEEEDFELDAIEDNELKDFLDDEEEETVDIIDPMAEDEEDVKDSYMDKVVLECSVCHSLIYKDPSEVVEDDESEEDLVNVGEECPYCMSTDGYKIVGQIAPFEVEADYTIEVEPKEDSEDDEEEEVTESFKRKKANKSLNESSNNRYDEIPTNDELVELAKSLGFEDEDDEDSPWFMNGDEFALQLYSKNISKLMRAMKRRWHKFNGKVYDDGSPMFVDDDGTFLFQIVNESFKNSNIRKSLKESDNNPLLISSNGNFILVNSSGVGINDTPWNGLEVISRKNARKHVVEVHLDSNSPKFEGDPVHFKYWPDSVYVTHGNRMTRDTLQDTKEYILVLQEAIDFSKMVSDFIKNNDEWNAEVSYNKKFGESLNFKTMPIPKKGSTFAFKATVDEPEISRLLQKKNLKFDKVNDNGTLVWLIGNEDTDHIATYVPSTKTLYTDKRELFRESYMTNDSLNEAFDINSMSRIKLIDAIDEFYREDEMLFSDNYITDDDKTMEDILDENGAASEDDVDASDSAEGFYYSMSNEQLKNVFQIIRNYLKTRDADEYNDYSSDIYSTFKLKRGWVDESLENLDIETEHDKIHIEAEEKTDDDEEMIVPIDPEVEDEIEDNSELANSEEEPDKEDVDIEEFDEESFDELGESFLKKHYSNVNSFKTTKIMDDGNNLFVEGLITFNSGSKKNTSFKFTPSTIRNNKVKFFGENLQINNGKKAFKLNGRLDNNKLIAESLTYNYIAKNQKNESKRVSGTVSLKESKVGKDLSKKEGSMSNIIEKNLNKINSSTSKDDLLNNLTKIFKDNGLNTEASNRLLSNVEKSKSFKAALSTVYNSYLAGSNLAVDRK